MRPPLLDEVNFYHLTLQYSQFQVQKDQAGDNEEAKIRSFSSIYKDQLPLMRDFCMKYLVCQFLSIGIFSIVASLLCYFLQPNFSKGFSGFLPIFKKAGKCKITSQSEAGSDNVANVTCSIVLHWLFEQGAILFILYYGIGLIYVIGHVMSCILLICLNHCRR